MNIKIENEKKAYIVPAMEIMNMESDVNLLTGSGEVKEKFGANDWYDELN